MEPDIAESAEFTAPTEYTVKLKPGLKFANGHDLTSSDVKFTFDRQVKINDENGPSSLLYNLDSTDAVDDTTVVFHLKSGNDQVFPQILSSPAGPIVDEEVFSADAADAGQRHRRRERVRRSVHDHRLRLQQPDLVQGEPGLPGRPRRTQDRRGQREVLRGLVEPEARRAAGQHRRRLPQPHATDIADLKTDDKVKVVDGPGGEIRYITFNFNTMPFGATTPEADPAKALAVRRRSPTSSTVTRSRRRSTRAPTRPCTPTSPPA